MKVKIKSCLKPSFWYVNSIGKEFSVQDFDKRSYYVILPSEGSLIRKVDCEIIEQSFVEQIIDEIDLVNLRLNLLKTRSRN